MASSWCTTRCDSEGEPTPPNNIIQCAFPDFSNSCTNLYAIFPSCTNILDCGIDINRPSCIRNLAASIIMYSYIGCMYEGDHLTTNLGVRCDRSN